MTYHSMIDKLFCFECARDLSGGIEKIFFNEMGEKPKNGLKGKMHYLNKKDSKYTRSKKFGLLLFIMGLVILILSFYIPALIAGHTENSYIIVGNVDPGSCIKMVGLFIILKNIDFKTAFGKYSEKINSSIVEISVCDFLTWKSNY